VERADQRGVPGQAATHDRSRLHGQSAGRRFLYGTGRTSDWQLHLFHILVQPGLVPRQNQRFSKAHERQMHRQHG